MQNNRKRKRSGWKIEHIIGMAFVVCIVFFLVLNIIVPNKEMSEEENRMLAGRPKLTIESLVSGDFMDKFETYQADQFVGRNAWRKLKTTLDRIGGGKEENGVLIGKKGQLMEEIATPDQEQLNANLKSMKSFAQSYPDINTSVMLVPDAANVLKNRLPALATVADQNRMFSQAKRELGESINWIDVTSSLKKHTDEKIFYKTDHHWTSLGAFYAFGDAVESLNIKSDAVSNFVAYPISTTFNGTLSAKAGCRLGEKEQIDIYVPKDSDADILVSYIDEQKKTASLYDSSKLKTRDRYGVFLGGNTSVIDIKTTSEESRRILIVKDSFANSFIPFLTPYFREIVVVDPRYYSGTIQDIMDSYRITDALFLYSGNTFFQDNNISGMLGAGKSE